MRRKILGLTLSLAMVFSAMGCGKDDGKSTTESRTSLVITTEATEAKSTEETTAADTEATTEESTEAELTTAKNVGFSIGHVEDGYYVDSEILESGMAYEASVDQIYITELENSDLKSAMTKLNEELQGDLTVQVNNVYNIMSDENFSFASANIPWKETTNLSVVRSDTKVLSMYKIHTANLNYHEDSVEVTGLSYDAATGKPLSLRTVLTDYDKMVDIVIEKLKETDTSKYCDNYADIASDLFYNGLFSSWAVNGDGLEIYFNNNTIAPVEVGAVKVQINRADYPSLFNSEYFYSEMESTEEGAPTFYNNASELYNHGFLSYAQAIGTKTLDECVKELEEAGFKCEVTDGMDDSYADICVTSGDETLRIYFYPASTNSDEEDSGDVDESFEPAYRSSSDLIMNCEFRNNTANSCVIIGHSMSPDDEVTYSYIDFTYHTQTYFTTENDLSAAYLTGMNK